MTCYRKASGLDGSRRAAKSQHTREQILDAYREVRDHLSKLISERLPGRQQPVADTLSKD